MNTRERFVNVLTGKPADRVPFMKVFGGTGAVLPSWEKEQPGLGSKIDEMLRFEGRYRGWDVTPVNVGLGSLSDPEVIEDTDTRRVYRRGDGAVCVWAKEQDYGHHVLEWPVKNRSDWDRVKSEFMDADDPGRFPADWGSHVDRYRDRDWPLQLTHGGVYGFVRNLMGDEALAFAFYDEPALVHEMMETYTSMAIAIWEKMVRDIQFDLIECWEDMASKNGAFISPAMFREFMKPQYERIASFARDHDIPIILVDSDGYIEDLTGLMFEAGVTALYPYEVQAGNDVLRVRESHREVGVIGGLDKQCMARGLEAIDEEMKKARRLIELGRFIPGPDHFVLSDVNFESYRYFMESLREVCLATTPGCSGSETAVRFQGTDT